tara:strand:+ start:953 stop:1066 length:114 start_codon:yes stop_codon:yes gene_type:complete
MKEWHVFTIGGIVGGIAYFMSSLAYAALQAPALFGSM